MSAPTPDAPGVVYPSIWRRLAAMVYESLLIAAILVGAGFAAGGASHRFEGWERWLFQLYLVGILGIYFIWCWRRGGRTPAMSAWRLRLFTSNGARLGLGRAVWRYSLALFAFGTGAVSLMLMRDHAREWGTWLALAPAVITVLWALVDGQRQFLHDRMAGTRMVLEPKTKKLRR
jgi:uncharacterized RDD family membrane protein YckC